jgi:general secretion pathway protein G
MDAKRWWLGRRAAVRAARGMTLLEIMVVIAIIGIVMTAIGVGVVGYLNKAKVSACKSQLANIANAVQMYALDGEYPANLGVLTEGAGAPLKPKQLKDPWGQEFQYQYPASDRSKEFDLCSGGPDKRPGGDDDICQE